MKTKLPNAIETYIRAVNAGDAATLQSTFADDAVVKDVDREFRGDPAIFVRERRESIGDREWLVLEFRNSRTRPPRSEISYFLPTDDGHITCFVIGEEASLPMHRAAIEAFLRKIQIQ